MIKTNKKIKDIDKEAYKLAYLTIKNEVRTELSKENRIISILKKDIHIAYAFTSANIFMVAGYIYLDWFIMFFGVIFLMVGLIKVYSK